VRVRGPVSATRPLVSTCSKNVPVVANLKLDSTHD
jgi:hypothetical protein